MATPRDSLRKVTDQWNAFLTEEERLFYQSDYFPFSMGQKGRFALGSWRGLPPGSRTVQFQHMVLDNPAYAAWNTQLIPRFRSWKATSPIGSPRLMFHPLPISKAPRVILTHFLDFIMNLSLIDIDFQRPYSSRGRLWLGGHNFLREGSEPNGRSSIQTTSYFGRITHRLSSRWQVQGWYYQAHNDFNLPPENPLAFTPDQLKERVILLGTALEGSLFSRDTTRVELFTQYLTDTYRENRQIRRRYQVTVPGLAVVSTGRQGKWIWQFQTRITRPISSGFPFRVLKENENRTLFTLSQKASFFQWQITGGAWFHSAFGWRPEGQVAIHAGNRYWAVSAGGYQTYRAQPTPLRAGTDTIPPFQPQDAATISAVEFSLKLQPLPNTRLAVTAFSGNYQHYPFLENSSQWNEKRVANRGIRGNLEISFSHFWFKGDVTLNTNWQQAFAPQWHGVFQGGFLFPLFHGALKARGIVTLNYFNNFRSLRFNRFWRYFEPSDTIFSTLPLADFRLFLSIRTLTLYFVWENMLSTDYTIVLGGMEYLRLFRLGLRWTLWN